MRFLVPALALALLGCQSRPEPPAVDAEVGTVTVVIDDGGEEPIKVTVDNVPVGETLETVMRSIKEVPIELSGSGTTAFVDSIGEQKTDATKGWTFTVDGEFANQGIGQTVLHPPTTVDWSFGEFEM